MWTDGPHQQWAGGQESGSCSVGQSSPPERWPPDHGEGSQCSESPAGCQRPYFVHADSQTARGPFPCGSAEPGGKPGLCLLIQLKRKPLQAAIRMEWGTSAG